MSINVQHQSDNDTTDVMNRSSSSDEQLIGSLLDPLASRTIPIRESAGQVIREQLSCAVCLEVYRLPTTIECGHTFCRSAVHPSHVCT